MFVYQNINERQSNITFWGSKKDKKCFRNRYMSPDGAKFRLIFEEAKFVRTKEARD